MSFSSLQNLQMLLVRLKLVDAAQLKTCLAAIQATGASIDGLISELERRHLLTSFQVHKLKKRESDGLRVGPYKVLYRNASGSFARVFRGSSVDDGRMVGLKILRSSLAEEPRNVSLFRREGELGKRLKHKNIVPIYEVGSDGNQHYLAMEFVEGGNFRELLKIRKKFPAEEASRYVLDMAEGLEYALGLGLTHRDLKLTNVLLSSQGVAKLVDFGLAGLDKGLATMEEEVDRAVEYATLERSTSAPDNDPRSDLYFLGAIYYELVTGIPPYPPTKNIAERKQTSRYRNVTPIQQVDSTVPDAVAKIIDRLMQFAPDERYQTSTEVIRDLRGLVGDRGGVEPTSTPEINTPANSGPSVLCVENRIKQQDVLRDYFQRHGYRVLMLRDAERAIKRLQSDPPSAMVMMADALGTDEETVNAFRRAVVACEKANTPLVLVVAKDHRKILDRFVESPISRVLTDHPVTLRNIRSAIEELRPK